MKIGKLVKQHIKQIFFHCDGVDHNEIHSLLDLDYSKETFGINFPFCIELGNIQESKRYWKETYLVRGKQVRVTSQWYEKCRPSFVKYLESKGIAREVSEGPDPQGETKAGGMKAADIRHLRELEEETRQLKQMYAEVSLENRELKDLLARKR